MKIGEENKLEELLKLAADKSAHRPDFTRYGLTGTLPRTNHWKWYSA